MIIYYFVIYAMTNEKMGDDGGESLISPDGVAPSWIVGVSASVIFPCTMKSRRRFLLEMADPAVKQL